MTDAAAEPTPAADPLARSALLAPNALSVPRTALAFGSAAAALVAIVLGHRDLGAFGWVEVSLLAAAIGVMLVDRVDAHVFVRSVLWGVLFYGVVDVLMHSHAHAPDSWEKVRAFTVLLGTGTSLLALGRAGLDGEHGSFFPIVMRRSLLTMMVVGLCVAHVMTVLAIDIVDHHPTLLATALVTPALLVVGVVGLSRTRAWGLFGYVAALLAAAGSVALFADPPTAWTTFDGHFISKTMVLGAAWAIGGAAAAFASLPVLFAVALKPRPRPADGGWGEAVHAALVLVVVGFTLYLALA